MNTSVPTTALVNSKTPELPATISREDLYALVWSEPMSRLALKFGMSDVGLAKACARLMVPVPGRGYWAKREVGRAPKPTRLPMLPANARTDQRELHVRRREAPPAREVASEPVEAIQVVVPDVLTEPHPLVAKSIRALRGGKSQHDGYLRPKAPECLDVNTTMGTIDRAMLIWDALIKAVEERGYPVEIQKFKRENYAEPEYRTVVVADGESVQIAISEPTKRVERPHDKNGAPYPRYEFLPSSRLSIAIKNWPKTPWSDSQKRTLESQLGNVILGIAAAAVEQKEARARREERERHEMEAQRRQWEEGERQRGEARKIRALGAAIDRMHEARWAREYLAQLHANLVAFPEACTAEMEQWLAWVEGHAARLDPSLTPATVPKDPKPYG